MPLTSFKYNLHFKVYETREKKRIFLLVSEKFIVISSTFEMDKMILGAHTSDFKVYEVRDFYS